MVRTALLLVRDSDATDDRPDPAVATVRATLARGPYSEVDFQVVPGEQAIIRARLRLWADSDAVDLILTCGGVGLRPRDRAPEATLEVVERVVPGLAELMRAAGTGSDRLAALSRGVVGVRRSTLIVNLPGEPARAGLALGAVLDTLPAAVREVSAAPGGVPIP